MVTNRSRAKRSQSMPEATEDGVQVQSIAPDEGRSQQSTTDTVLQQLVDVLKAANQGDFSARLPETAELGEVAPLLNQWLDTNAQFVDRLAQVHQAIAIEGQLSRRLEWNPPHQTWANQAWATSVAHINDLIHHLVMPMKEAERVLQAIAQGDLSQRMNLAIEGRALQGELLHVGTIVNDMVDQLDRFAGEVTRVAQAIGNGGELGIEAVVVDAAGVWQQTIRSINGMSANLAEQIRSIAQICLAVAEGNLGEQIQAQNAGELRQLTESVNRMITNLSNSIQQMADVATTVASASEELSAISGNMTNDASQTAEQATSASASAEQVSQNASTVATAVEEMNASIREIANNAAIGAKVATNAVSTADVTNQTIAKLGQSSIEIGKVIKVITSIAQQTNLLALNATIEAARAGDAGKGFAVVANEVKELAKQTAVATEDISQRIEAIQSDTQGAVTAITEITQIINQINDIQNTIASAVEEQTATTNEIARNVSEAARGSSDIAKNIGIVAQNAQNTTLGASNTLQAANELARLAGDLQRVVMQFKY